MSRRVPVATVGVHARPAREEADALPTFPAHCPPALHTGAVLNLSPRCGPRGAPCGPARPSAPGTGTPARAAAACHGPAPPGPPPPSAWVASRLPQPIRLPEPVGTALPAATAGGHVSGALCRSSCDPQLEAPLGPAAAAPRRRPTGRRSLRESHAAPSCRGRRGATKGLAAHRPSWLQQGRVLGGPRRAPLPGPRSPPGSAPAHDGPSTGGLGGHWSFESCETLVYKFQGLWPHLDRDVHRD